jgi:hypothetical protein
MKMSSRSVLEAYAITIEIIAEYIKSVWTSLNVPRQEPKRVPPRIYSVALEAILETILPDRAIFMDEYVYGKAGSDVYWAVALTAYAAMQVPVVEDPQGDAIIMGSLKQLHPALRLHAMIQGLIGGHIPNPLETYSSRQDSRVVMQWLIECHKFIGDPWSIKFAQHISSVVAGMPERYSRPASMHDLSWAARAAFCSEPYEMIGDGGIWLGLLPRFVRTSDDCILVYGDVDVEGDRDQVFAAFIGANALYVLEAMVFGKSWDVCWDKVCGFSPEQKIEAMRLASAFYLHKSGIEYENTPVISLINGFQ